MGFVAVCTALYDYSPQSEGELLIKEGELIYILNKQTDEENWWKAKKKAESEEDDEPVGLIPYNYVEEVRSPLFLRSHHGSYSCRKSCEYMTQSRCWP